MKNEKVCWFWKKYEFQKKFVDLDIFACLKNTNLKSGFLGFEKICGFQKKIHGFRKSSWILITICIWKKFVNLKDVQEFDCFSYFEKVHEFEKRRTEKWKRKTAPEKTCGTFYPWDEKNKNRCERGQTLFGALSARYRVNGTGCTPPCPRWAGPQSFLSALKKAKKKADTLLGFFHNSETSPFPRMARPLNFPPPNMDNLVWRICTLLGFIFYAASSEGKEP